MHTSHQPVTCHLFCSIPLRLRKCARMQQELQNTVERCVTNAFALYTHTHIHTYTHTHTHSISYIHFLWCLCPLINRLPLLLIHSLPRHQDKLNHASLSQHSASKKLRAAAVEDGGGGGQLVSSEPARPPPLEELSRQTQPALSSKPAYSIVHSSSDEVNSNPSALPHQPMAPSPRAGALGRNELKPIRSKIMKKKKSKHKLRADKTTIKPVSTQLQQNV